MLERESQRLRELLAARELADTQSQAAAQLKERALFLTGAFTLAIVLAVVAIFFWNQASHNALEARSRELAAAAISNLGDDPERSILLSLQALQTSHTLEAENALHRSILESRVIFVLHHGAEVWSVTYSPDGKRIGTASQDKLARIWDAETGQLLLLLKGHNGSVNGIAFSPDGKHHNTQRRLRVLLQREEHPRLRSECCASLLPADFSVTGDERFRFTIGERSANELNAYASHEHTIDDRLKLEYGMRIGLFSVSGDADRFNFDEIGELDVDFHEPDSRTYFNLQPRLSAVYKLDESSSVKAGYMRGIFNTSTCWAISNSGTPLDIWQPSTRILPQIADQISLGYYRIMQGAAYELSAEMYYKYLIGRRIIPRHLRRSFRSLAYFL